MPKLPHAPLPPPDNPLNIQHNLPHNSRLRPNSPAGKSLRGKFRRQQFVSLLGRDELHELEHCFAVVGRPGGPGVWGESFVAGTFGDGVGIG
jgi:hypothetical protein